MKKVKICLIDPAHDANSNVPNIGLAAISAGLDRLNVEHCVIDQSTQPFPKDRFLKVEAEIYGISVKFNTYKEAQRITKLLKEKRKCSVVWGGAFVRDSLARCIRENDNVDHLVDSDYDYFGIQAAPERDLDSLPFPSFDKFDSLDFLRSAYQSGEFIYPISTSRGCPYRCTFCSSQKTYKFRHPQGVADEIFNAKVKYGIKNFQILDDCFNLLEDRTIEICDLIKKFDLKWMCTNGLRADKLTPKVCKALANSGCYFVNLGIESSDQKVLDAIKKGETIKDIEKAIGWLQSESIGVGGFFIIGLPGSTPESDMESYVWAAKHGIYPHFGVLVAIEGTEIYKDKEHLLGEPYRTKFFGNNLDVNYETKEYPASERMKVYMEIMGNRSDCKIQDAFKEKYPGVQI